MKISNGVKVTAISNSELIAYGVKEGYILSAINNKKIFSVDDVNDIISNKAQGEIIRIEMLNLDGELERYVFN